MAQNWMRITHQDDKIQLSWQRGYESPRFASEVPFQQPFDEENAAELRWYLEDYLQFPYGIFPDNAVKIEQKLQQWGQQLFELVFRSTEKGREFFQEATREGLDNCELGIISDNAEVLNLPWELLYSPDYQFLAPSLAGMYRSLSSQGVKAPLPAMPNDQLNILLVIARPEGEQDVGFKTIARPLLAALQPIRQRVNLKVLRPPSLKAFEAELQVNKGFYHIVHFDGHGNFDSETQGVLVFEDEQGNEQAVSAREIAQYLTDCRVPIFVLNACKSGQVGEEAFSSVAGQLVKLGAKGVVAMAYTIKAKGAEHFIGRLYGELVRGECIATAVAAGRKSMSIDKMRPSPKGNLPLQDWLVPVLYQQEPYTPFVPKKTAPSFTDLMAQADNTPESSKAVGLPDESAYGFIGRDYEILRLERAFRQNHLVLVQGMGGVGKTELAAGFARWLDDTQGRTGGMFFTSFEQGAGLSQVINQIGRALGGERFSQMMPEQQDAVVRQYLQTHPCLLIWDNFEPVNGFPTGNEPLLSGEERNKLKRFLKELRGGKSWVLITSRREEAWLDCGYSLINLRGLSQADAQELAAKILQTVGVERKNLPAEYLELLKLLGGHPLSLRVVLPHLKTQTPVQLIEALRRGLDTFRGAEEDGRDKSLMVSLDYSFAKLSKRTRQHLPFLALFSDRVYAGTLSHFSKDLSFDNLLIFRQKYKDIFGENLEIEDWLKILNEAAKAGILENTGDGIYKIHPALPWYLRQHLSQHHNIQKVSELERKLMLFYLILAVAHDIQDGGNADTATTVLLLEEPNLLQYLRFALNQKAWSVAAGILRALGQVYDILGFTAEYRSLRRKALAQIGTNLAEIKANDESAFGFWTYLKSADALEALRHGEIENARLIHQEILNVYTALDDSSVIGEIAIAYVNLGTIARETNDFDAAYNYYQSGLKIYKDAGDFYQAAAVYYELGVTARQQGRFKTATQYYQKAFKIYEDAGDLHRLIGIYQEMGVVARYKGDYTQAILNYTKALHICEQLGHDYFAAGIYHELGEVAKLQGNLDFAKPLYYKALQIYEDKEDWYNASDEYQGLGEIAKLKSNFDEAIAYFQKALDIRIELKISNKISATLIEYGKTLEQQNNYADALQFYIQVLGNDIKHRHNEEWIYEDIQCLARILHQLKESQFQHIWREATGEECAGEVREAIWTARDRLETES